MSLTRKIQKPKSLMIFVVIFAAIGTSILIFVHASSPTASFEPESGTIKSPAIVGSDPLASNGIYLQFKKASINGHGAAYNQLGFYPGFANVNGYTALEAFIGHQTKYVVQFGGGDVQSLEGSVWGQLINQAATPPTAFQTLNKRLTFIETVPLTLNTTGTSTGERAAALQATTSGANDSSYNVVANYLKTAGYPNAIVRIGWEFDGTWYPWAAPGAEPQYVQAFQHVVRLFRSVSPNFRFDWNGDPNLMPTEAAAYPGDSYVDIIGMDVYDKDAPVAWNSSTQTWSNPTAAWNTILPSLQWQRNFAISHSKQISYPEWALSGVNSSKPSNVGGDSVTFIQNMHDWMDSLPASGGGSLAYATYFNEDAGDGNHRINANFFPNASTRFKSIFGGP